MSTHRARITDEWLPLPEDLLRELGWKEGDSIELEVVGTAVVLTLPEGQPVVQRPAPSKKRGL